MPAPVDLAAVLNQRATILSCTRSDINLLSQTPCTSRLPALHRHIVRECLWACIITSERSQSTSRESSILCSSFARLPTQADAPHTQPCHSCRGLRPYLHLRSRTPVIHMTCHDRPGGLESQVRRPRGNSELIEKYIVKRSISTFMLDQIPQSSRPLLPMAPPGVDVGPSGVSLELKWLVRAPPPVTRVGVPRVAGGRKSGVVVLEI